MPSSFHHWAVVFPGAPVEQFGHRVMFGRNGPRVTNLNGLATQTSFDQPPKGGSRKSAVAANSAAGIGAGRGDRPLVPTIRLVTSPKSGSPRSCSQKPTSTSFDSATTREPTWFARYRTRKRTRPQSARRHIAPSPSTIDSLPIWINPENDSPGASSIVRETIWQGPLILCTRLN